MIEPVKKFFEISSGRATALLASLTFSRSFLVRNRLTEAMTRSPAVHQALRNHYFDSFGLPGLHVSVPA
jgi:hypothetical protein